MKILKKKILPLILLSGFVLGMTASCDTVNTLLNLAFEQPKVSINSFSIADASLESFNFNLMLDVDNPNSVAIKTSNVDYNLDINKADIIKGVLKKGIDIGANKTSSVEIPIQVNFQKIIQALPSILLDLNNLNYNVYGVVNFDTPIGTVPINWKNEGKLNMSNFSNLFPL